MKRSMRALVMIILVAATAPLCFANMYTGVGHLPDGETGEIVEVVFRHSLFETVCDGIHPSAMILYAALALASIILSAVGLITDNGKVQNVGRIAFWTVMVIFVFLLLIAATMGRGY